MVSAVILAAGASTCMGAQKLLLPLGGEPLVRWTVRQVCDAGFDDVLVVSRVRSSVTNFPERGARLARRDD